MNGDVQYDLSGGHVSFDVLYRLDQLAATLTGHLGWRVVVEVDPGITLTASPARGLAPAHWPSEAPLAAVQGQNTPTQAHTAPAAAQGGTA